MEMLKDDVDEGLSTVRDPYPDAPLPDPAETAGLSAWKHPS